VYFQSRDKDGGHTIRSAMGANNPATPKLDGSVFYKTGVIAD